MRRLIAGIALAIALTALCGGSLHAANCEFRLGFKTLRDLIGHGIVGECLENEYYNAIGDSNQRTTGGLMAWRKADNWTAFTDGYRTWINGPNGLVVRLNTERFPWEADHIHTPPPTPGPAPPPAPTAAPQPTIDPTLAHAYHVMRQTQAGNILADRFSQLGASAVFGELGDSSTRWDHSPPRITIDFEYRNESPEALAYLLVWPTTWLDFYSELGEMESWEACMSMEFVAKAIQTRYWLQSFGSGGKRNAAQGPETWANEWVEVRLKLGDEESLLHWLWVTDGTREFCEAYGVPVQFIDPDLSDAYLTAIWGDPVIGMAAVEVLMETGVDVTFGSLPRFVQGRYSTRNNLITISESLRGQSRAVLAAVLLHETYHAQEAYNRGYRPSETAAACLQEEVDAFRIEARWWYDWFGRGGKQNPNSVERFNNALMWAWYSGDDSLVEWVLLSEDYQEQCLGGVVE